jgi:two-component system, NtrC family, sensor kinase
LLIPILDKLPTILTLAVLVGIFVALRKHSESERTRLWNYAWALIFIHFLIQIFETHTGTLENVVETIDLASLELSGVVFAVSMSRYVENRRLRNALLGVLAIPTAFHATAAVFDWKIRSAMVACIFIVTLGAAGFTFFIEEPNSGFAHILAAIVVLTGSWAMHQQWRGNSGFAINALLTLTFGLSGPLFWRRTQRWSPGVAAVTCGFIAWGAVFPAATLLFYFYPKLALNPELWNVPKFFVAIGMVLTALEDQSLLVEQARAREHSENLLLNRLSQISSRLLAGSDPASLCSEIADGITRTTSFRRAALFVTGEDRDLKLAGASGLTQEEREQFAERANMLRSGGLEKLQDAGAKLGNSAVVLRAGQFADFAKSPANSESEKCVVIIPLSASVGGPMGALWLSTPLHADELDSSEVAKLEMLAADLGVAMENSRLQRQLRRSEKLASLGQLVGGVAHELNNPLTGILGYSELLLSTPAHDGSTRPRLTKIGEEARRMQRIVSGLLRFARQSNPDVREANLAGTIRDVVQLREYHLRKIGIEVEQRLDSTLPLLAIGEGDLKQVLLNVLNNSMDAVEHSPVRMIRISAIRHHDRVAIRVEDTGTGFSDLNRAFDPFYTTKPVGKGSGLGLSVCYGIVKECGGEMALANPHNGGACVAIEIPAVTAHASAARAVAVPA